MSEKPIAALMKTQKQLEQAGFAEAGSMARILVCAVLACDMNGLLINDKPLEAAEQDALCGMVQSVVAGVPVQYAVGFADFMGLRFSVNADVLIPRMDTETLVQWAIERAPRQSTVLDVCTGSGCIAIALKHHRPDLAVFACDISENALKTARQNAKKLGADVFFAKGDLCAPFANRTFAIILSNPPYIGKKEWDNLCGQVKDHEPALALIGGEDGLSFYRRLIPQACALLDQGGFLGVEIGFDQAQAVSRLFTKHGLKDICVIEDMEHRQRVVAGQWREQR